MYSLNDFGITHKDWTLPNGLHATLLHKPYSPIYVDIGIRAGAVFDPVGKEGLAHFCEHLLVAGSDELSKEEFSAIMESIGAMWNASTGRYSMHIICEVAQVEHLANVQKYFQHSLERLHITEQMVENEKNIVISEIERARSKPERLFGWYIDELIGTGTRYAHSVLGTKDSVLSFTVEDVLGYLKDKIRVENMALTVSGGATERELSESLGHLGLVAGKMKTPDSEPKMITVNGTVSHCELDTPQTKILVMANAPDPDTREAHLLNFALRYAHHGISSLFYRKIRNEQQLAYDLNFISESFDTYGYVGTMLGVPKDKTEQAITAVKDCYVEFIETAMTQKQIDDKVGTQWFSAIRNMQQSADWVSVYNSDILYPPKVELYGGYPDIYNYRTTYTEAEVRDVLHKYIKPDRMDVITGGQS